jgi:hypothetical protein
MEYRPLDQEQREIRLLTIIPLEDISRNSIEPVKCNLEHVSGRQAASCSSSGDIVDRDSSWGEFAALSYAWGDPKDTREIYVNEHSVFVTKNLEAALRQFRVAAFKHYLPFWVDALCINQEDVDERNQQVQRMRSIYTKAEVVVAWLGPAADESEKAMGFINILGASFDPNTAMLQQLRTEPGEPDYIGHGIARSIYKLFCRPYWQRLWVLQEISLRNVRVMCGEEWTLWVHVYVAVLRVRRNWSEYQSIIRTDVAHNRLYNELSPLDRMLRMGDCRREVMKAGLLNDIGRLVEVGRQLQTTDPHDKVYGMLGLVDPALCAALAPNYGLDVEDVYLMFAEKVIKIGTSLEILKTVYANTASNSLPSWVPRLDSTSRAHFIGHAWVPPRHFSCSGKMKLTVSFPFPKQLQAQGILLDAVDGLGAVHDWDYKFYTEDSLDRSIKQVTHGGNAYGNADAIREALWQTILSGPFSFSDKTSIDYHTFKLPPYIYSLPPPDADAPFGSSSSFVSLLISQNEDLSLFGLKLPPMLCAAEDSNPIDQRLMGELITTISAVTAGRRLMITRKGYLGLAPVYARPGDLIVILPSCSVPLILRRSGEYFIVIGDSYIQGIMNGEAVANVEKANDRLESLTLI